MNVSGPIKVFALLGVVAAVAIGGWMMLLAPGGAEAEAAPEAISSQVNGLLKATAAARKVAAKANADAKKNSADPEAAATPATPAAKATSKPAVKAAAKPAVKAAAKPTAKAAAKPAAKPKAVKKRARIIAANGLPMRLVAALRSHDVVVVALWGTGGEIDGMARDEAAVGAASVRAGFLALNVIGSPREAEALTLKLGVVLRAPTVLFFTRGGVLANTLDGFRDSETVAQAALDALR